MRNQIRLRGVVAFLLALSLIFMGSISAFADDPVTVDLGGIPYLEITAGEDPDEIHYCDYGAQEDDLPSGSTITAGPVGNGLLFGMTEYDYDLQSNVPVEDFAGQVTVQVGDVGAANNECTDSAVWINASGEDTSVDVETGILYSGFAGVLVDNADASVDVKTKGINVSGNYTENPYGVFLGDSYAAIPDYAFFGDGEACDAYTGKEAITEVYVDGDINVTADYFTSTGIDVGGTPFTALTGGDITVNATGSLNITDVFAQGVAVYEDGGSADISVGSVHAKGKAASYGALLVNYGTGSTSVTVGDGISASTGDAPEEDSYALGISALSTEDAAKTSVTVEAGGISVTGGNNQLEDPNPFAYNTTAIITHNAAGEIGISVAGDVTSTGYGMMLFDSASEMSDDYGDADWDDEDKPSNTEGEQEGSAGSGKTLVEVTGDVTADECGVYFNLQNDTSTTAVLIDGTLSGENTSVLLSKETVLDHLTLTVWEVRANNDGNLVERIDNWAEDDNNPSEDMATVADRELEKKIQYIIKIDPAWQNRIGTSGTKSYKQDKVKIEKETGEGIEEETEEEIEYQVANEGDRITLLKLDIPEGKRIAAAYWDKARSKSCKLLQDKATGDFYLTVPKGGGVWLSVVLEDAHAKTAPNALLSLKDADNKISIRFFKGGHFIAEMESGKPSESGLFLNQEDKLVLVGSNGQQIPVNEDGSFTYTSVEDPSLNYEFAMTADQYALLLANAKK